MYKSLLLGCLTVHAAAVMAQPVIEAPTPPPNGYTGQVLAAGFIEPTAGSSEAQSWDFSGVNGSMVSNMGMNHASTSLFAPEYPGAEWVLSVGDQLTFLDYTGLGVTVLGNANSANGVALTFEDPLVQWPLPVEFGFSHEDAFSVDQMLFDEPYSLLGNVTSTGDAWGSIVLPNGTTIGEVLRVNYSQFYVESYAGDTAQWTLDQVMYVAPDSVLPVFFHEELTVTDNQGEVLLVATDVAWYDNTVLGMGEEAVLGASAWPNPVEQGSFLNLDGARKGARIMDLGGRTVWTLPKGHGEGLKVSTDHWRSGPYLYIPFEGAHPIRIIVQ